MPIRITRDSNGEVSFGSLDKLIQGLIILNLIGFAVETLPDLDASFRVCLELLEAASLIAFTGEYIARVGFSRARLRYACSFFGVIDLFAILPSLLATGIDLRSLRIVRLLRIVRILKLARYSSAIARLHRAFSIIREELLLFGAFALTVLYLSAVGIYFFENEAQPAAFPSVFHSLWWAVTTLTTVGYGDIYPITLGGRIFTFFVLIVGLGIVAVPSGLIASGLTKARDEEKDST